MLKKVLSVALSCLLISVTTSAVYASSQDDKRAREIAKVKESVRKLGIGPEAHVEVTLHDGSKFKGTIREATDDTFLVLEQKTQQRPSRSLTRMSRNSRARMVSLLRRWA